MKVKMLANGKTCEFESSYAARLIEQGRAVPAPAEATKPKSTEAAKGAKAAEK